MSWIIKKMGKLIGIQAGADGNNRPPRHISLRKVNKATEKFNNNRKIGEGSTAIVYRGTRKGQDVAVKRLGLAALLTGEYQREVEMLTRLSHPNIIKLIRFCDHEGERFTQTERILVYEYMRLRSVRDLLHARLPGEERLGWATRMRIAAGVAQGLSYLHEDAAPPVVFRDLKSADVLLGPGYHPKISDFGAALNVPGRGQTSVVVGRPNAGTRQTNPHWAPESAICHKADVYSFGVLLLEIVTRETKFPETAANRVMGPAEFIEMADPELNGNFLRGELLKAMSLATLCMNYDPSMRPDMINVVLAMKNLAGEPDAVWPAQFVVAGDQPNAEE